ncbi:hypothetical protein CALVIDRAFT_466497, partial [Calocera viscosa TUFC12733]
LIVMPANIITQWANEIHDHTSNPKLSCLKWRAGDRLQGKSGTALLQKYDVVLTSYDQLVAEWDAANPSEGGPLFRVSWVRLALDECHNIRNRESKRSQAVCDLQA